MSPLGSDCSEPRPSTVHPDVRAYSLGAVPAHRRFLFFFWSEPLSARMASPERSQRFSLILLAGPSRESASALALARPWFMSREKTAGQL